MSTKLMHESYLQAVRQAVTERAFEKGVIDSEQAKRMTSTKLLYGAGTGAYRGVTYYQTWQNGKGKVDTVEIAAIGQESYVQIAGTLTHELAHVLAGYGVGHGKEWKALAAGIGFAKEPKAAGQRYYLAMFQPWLRKRVWELAKDIGDGHPDFLNAGLFTMPFSAPRPCGAGKGVRGGKSHGKGSGRMRLYECECVPPVKIRHGKDGLAAHCDECQAAFTQP